MSSPYQVLDNRSLDQWKVTELKEELKRRKLTSSGLKQDLIRRLDEAVRIEREQAAKEANIVSDCEPTHPVDGLKDEATEPFVTETAESNVDPGGNKSEKVGNVKVQVDINDSVADVSQGEVQVGDLSAVGKSAVTDEEQVVSLTTVKTSDVTENEVSEVDVSEQDLQHLKSQSPNGDSKTEPDDDNCKAQVVNEDLRPQLESDGSKAPRVGDILNPSTPKNQVSEVSSNLGFQVNSDSISTDSVSINEKIEFKDNIIADNVKLEIDVVKPEMVEPSSSNVVPDGGESHPMDVEEPQQKELFIEENDDNKSANANMKKTNDTADVGYSEKLNLDRSSGDDSVEEDVPDNKQIDSNSIFGEVGDKSEKCEVSEVKEESVVDITGDGLSPEKKDVLVENKNHLAVAAEKRKLNDQEAVVNDEPPKRQRRWNNSGSAKVSEPQVSSLASATTHKEIFQSTAPKRIFSRSDSKASDDSPKERVVPPSQKPPTDSLRIDNFVRPFTLKAVQELLGKTGSVISFWMDNIKTHCYVTYSSVDEAIATRNAVYNLQWPPYGGKLLVAEFVDPQEVKMHVEGPPQDLAAPAASGPPVPPVPSQPLPSPGQKGLRQQLSPAQSLPARPPLSNLPPARERINLPPPPPPPEKVEQPIVTLDDLFKKTKATPRIYYLPLSEEQVAAKLAARDRNLKT